jgi:hypothetical protein
MMTVYRGIVRGRTIELAEPTDLPDGTEVEVRPAPPPETETDRQQREQTFREQLLETGRIWSLPSQDERARLKNPTPVPITGAPLSETIIEDRR